MCDLFFFFFFSFIVILTCCLKFIFAVQPVARKAYGRLLFLILYQSGVVEDFDVELLAEIENMPSFVSMELFATKGAAVRKTVDCFTFAGVIRLVNSDQEALVRDYDRIHAIEEIGFIKFE